KAAALCSVSQPALSQQILTLEALCGTPLFDRLKSGAMLPPFGREFIDLAQKTIAAAGTVNAMSAGRSGQLDRPLRFGLITTVAPYLLPEIFPALQAGLPGLDFTTSENRTEALSTGLIDGNLDVALIAIEPPEHDLRLVSTPLFEDRFVLATSCHEAPHAPVSLSTLAPYRILLLDEGHCFRDQTIAACRIEKVTPARAPLPPPHCPPLSNLSPMVRASPCCPRSRCARKRPTRASQSINWRRLAPNVCCGWSGARQRPLLPPSSALPMSSASPAPTLHRAPDPSAPTACR
ncbi:MAG: LysR substrate-binding domain-containing protein, partial [Candidatus Devosia euplotis]|nr:LysR substrate-binding domain-containing protein [Candidatus Devosia euplotis]